MDDGAEPPETIKKRIKINKRSLFKSVKIVFFKSKHYNDTLLWTFTEILCNIMTKHNIIDLFLVFTVSNE